MKATRVSCEIDRRDVQLTLTYSEAQALLAITAHVGGSASKTRRGVTDALASALQAAGVSATAIQGSLSGSLVWGETRG